MAARRQPAVPAAPAGLIPLDAAVKIYPAIAKRTLRNMIAAGKLAAVKIGKRVFVGEVELTALFTPKLREQPGKPEPAPVVPTATGMAPCDTCGAVLSSADHRAKCGT